MARRGVAVEEGVAAVVAWRGGGVTPRPVMATAVRFTLQVLAQASPGGSVEVRVPPFGAVQCVPGLRHRRGTPPNVVEMDASTWLEVATGAVTWGDAVESGRVRCSGTRADLAGLLPLALPGGPAACCVSR